MFAVAQPKRDHGQRGYAAPIELREPEALSDPDAYAPGGTGSRHSAITTSTSGLSSIAATCSAVVSMCRHASAILMNAERYLLGTSNAIASLSIGFGFRRRRPRFAAAAQRSARISRKAGARIVRHCGLSARSYVISPHSPARTLPRDKWCFFDGSFRLNHEAFQG